MKWSWFIVAFVAAVMAAGAGAQTVEFRVVERTGRAVVTGPGDAELNVAVQARVVGGAGTACLGQFSFNIHLVGESDFNGALVRGLISNVDHTYATELATSAVVGRGGLASQYTYLAAAANGLNGGINATASGIFNGPEQEIANITGAAMGGALLGTPGMDVDGDSQPDTWSGNGTGTVPANNVTASISAAVAGLYFGAGGEWIDVYRFRYTLRNFPAHSFVVRLEGITASIGTVLEYQSGLWRVRPESTPAASAAELTVSVADPNPGACCDLATGACTVTLAGECSGAFFGVSACAATTCPAVGMCCDTAGACFFVMQGYCDNVWSAAGTCVPNMCPPLGTCCTITGSCSMAIAARCVGIWSAGGTCAPNDCAQPGHCCRYTSGCLVAPQTYCGPGNVWGPGASCTPSPCGPVVCCSGGTGACVVGFGGGCPTTGANHPMPGTTCSPNPCGTVACCNTSTRTCVLIGTYGTCPAGTVSNGFNTSCSPNICPGVVCCHPFTGACLITVPGGRCVDGYVVQGTGGVCAATSCPTVVCCNGTNGSCSIVGPSGVCPIWAVVLGPGTCAPSPCPPHGRCCGSGNTCTFVTASVCSGTWIAGESCSQNICPQLGACCRAGTCTTTFSSGCTPGEGRVFRGAGTLCGPMSNRLDCCPANFNRVNGVDVQDVFEFSAAWFAQSVSADFDSNGTVTISDYFQFLSAWMAGCQ